jgi:hypothetical protein
MTGTKKVAYRKRCHLSKKYFTYYSASVPVFDVDSAFAGSVVSDFTVLSLWGSLEGAFFPP